MDALIRSVSGTGGWLMAFLLLSFGLVVTLVAGDAIHERYVDRRKRWRVVHTHR
jgi:hypothetical protein